MINEMIMFKSFILNLIFNVVYVIFDLFKFSLNLSIDLIFKIVKKSMVR